MKTIDRLKTFLPAILMTVLLAGCSLKEDSEDQAAEQNLTDSRLEVKCKIDEDKIAKILQQEIPEQIDCIKTNINVFLRVVKPDGPNYRDKLSRRALEGYIKKNKPDLKDALKYFDLFFDLSHLLFGDPYGYISKANIDRLTVVLSNFNKEMAAIYPYLRNEPNQTETYKIHQVKKERVEQAARSISNQLLKIFTENIPVDTQINYLDLIDVFEKADNREDIAKMKKLAYVKKAILGGITEYITQKELRALVEKIPTLTSVLYNFVKLDNIIFQSEVNRYQLFSSTITDMEKILDSDGLGSEVIISNDDLYETLRIFQDEIGLKDPDKYYDAIELAKQILMGKGGDITGTTLYKLIGQLSTIVQKGLVFSQTYELYSAEMAKTGPVNGANLKNPYNSISEPERYKNFEHFVKIVKGFRYFKGGGEAPYFGNDIKRNVKGVIEVGMFEYIVETAFRFFEKKYPCTDSRFIRQEHGQVIDRRCKGGEDFAGTMNAYQLEEVILELKDILIEIGLVTPTLEVNTAENAYLMTDLFQLQSNDDTWIDISEATEFAIQVVTATAMKKNIMSAMSTYCEAQYADLDQDGVEEEMYSVTCFRKNFFKILKQKFKTADGKSEFTYGDYLPRLIKYYDDKMKQPGGEAGVLNFIAKLESFARTCSDEAIPMRRGDIINVFGGLFNIESTMTRFDPNKNNQMDANEVEASWSHFEAAVVNIVKKTNPDGVQFSKNVFQYLIKHKKIPTTTELLKFIAFDWNKWAAADRITIATILSEIKLQSDNRDPVVNYCNDLKNRL